MMHKRTADKRANGCSSLHKKKGEKNGISEGETRDGNNREVAGRNMPGMCGST